MGNFISASQVSSVGIVTKLRAGVRGIVVHFPGKARELSLLKRFQTECGATRLPIQKVQEDFVPGTEAAVS